MRPIRRAAIIWLIRLGIATIAATTSAADARASELSLMLRIRRDYFASRIPMSKNFHPCFTVDQRGMQVLSFCAEDDKKTPARLPAAVASPTAPKKPIKK